MAQYRCSHFFLLAESGKRGREREKEKTRKRSNIIHAGILVLYKQATFLQSVLHVDRCIDPLAPCTRRFLPRVRKTIRKYEGWKVEKREGRSFRDLKLLKRRVIGHRRRRAGKIVLSVSRDKWEKRKTKGGKEEVNLFNRAIFQNAFRKQRVQPLSPSLRNNPFFNPLWISFRANVSR